MQRSGHLEERALGWVNHRFCYNCFLTIDDGYKHDGRFAQCKSTKDHITQIEGSQDLHDNFFERKMKHNLIRAEDTGCLQRMWL